MGRFSDPITEVLINQKKLLISDIFLKNLYEVKASLHLGYVILNVPIICVVISLLFISKSYPLFIRFFVISILL